MKEDYKKQMKLHSILIFIIIIFMILFLIVALVLFRLDRFTTFWFSFLIILCFLGLIASILMYIPFAFEPNESLIGRFVKKERYFFEGKWHKNSLYSIAHSISIFTVVLTFWIIYIEKQIPMAVIMTFVFSIASIYIYYCGYQRSGWEFKMIDNNSYEDVVEKIMNVFNDNKIEFTHIDPVKPAINCKDCKSFLIKRDNIFFSIFNTPPFIIVGLGKIDSERENTAYKIKELIDNNFKLKGTSENKDSSLPPALSR